MKLYIFKPLTQNVCQSCPFVNLHSIQININPDPDPDDPKVMVTGSESLFKCALAAFSVNS
jgi:hypothetical protein